jgi:hypothetical protein
MVEQQPVADFLVSRSGPGKLSRPDGLADVVSGGAVQNGLPVNADAWIPAAQQIDEPVGDVVHGPQMRHQPGRYVETAEEDIHLVRQ